MSYAVEQSEPDVCSTIKPNVNFLGVYKIRYNCSLYKTWYTACGCILWFNVLHDIIIGKFRDGLPANLLTGAKHPAFMTATKKDRNKENQLSLTDHIFSLLVRSVPTIYSKLESHAETSNLVEAWPNGLTMGTSKLGLKVKTKMQKNNLFCSYLRKKLFDLHQKMVRFTSNQHQNDRQPIVKYISPAETHSFCNMSVFENCFFANS